MMQEVVPFKKFKTEVQQTDAAQITILTAEHEISVKEQIETEAGTLIASYFYNSRGLYKLVYTIVAENGTVQAYAEPDGILPTLFKGPDQQPWVSIIPHHPDKELEISVPLFQRGPIEMPKGKRPFTGQFIGLVNQSAVFYDVDIWSDLKPDRLLNIEFKGQEIKKKHLIKIALPKNNKISIQQNEIHLLAKEARHYLHRQIDAFGNELQRRVFQFGSRYVLEILELNFSRCSLLLSEKKGKLSLLTIDSDNSMNESFLIDIKDQFYNSWTPDLIDEQTYVTRFNTEYGNGWFVISKGKLIEFFYSKGIQGYINLVNQEKIELPYGELVISGISKTSASSYAVVLYPMPDEDEETKQMIILNRKLKSYDQEV
jgi:hypothetical protein